MDRSAKLRTLLREYRRARGWTQIAMAQELGMPRFLYGRIETGKRRLREDEFIAVCAVLGVDRDALLREAGYTAFEKE